MGVLSFTLCRGSPCGCPRFLKSRTPTRGVPTHGWISTLGRCLPRPRIPDGNITSKTKEDREGPENMSAENLWDVVVAGAGIGGMALAIRLARQGYRVALVERRTPGTFRVGESLDWEAPVYLKRVGFSVDA